MAREKMAYIATSGDEYKMNCQECAMTSLLQPCEACRCPIHGAFFVPEPDPANKGRTSIWVCPTCLKNKHQRRKQNVINNYD
jgi:hypothetical protein